VLLLLARMVQGLSVGGEYGTSSMFRDASVAVPFGVIGYLIVRYATYVLPSGCWNVRSWKKQTLTAF